MNSDEHDDGKYLSLPNNNYNYLNTHKLVSLNVHSCHRVFNEAKGIDFKWNLQTHTIKPRILGRQLSSANRTYLLVSMGGICVYYIKDVWKECAKNTRFRRRLNCKLLWIIVQYITLYKKKGLWTKHSTTMPRSLYYYYWPVSPRIHQVYDL